MSDPAVLPYGLVIDDHPLVARGIVEFLRAHPMLRDAVAAESPAAALQWIVQRGAPGIVLLDFWLGGDTASTFVRQLERAHPGVRVLAMSGDDRPDVREAMLSAGAHGFVGKHEAPAVFQQAVTAVMGGAEWFAPVPQAGEDGESTREVPVTPQALGLTERQGEILSLLLRGLPNKRIAQELGLSESTVKEHVSSILHRLGAQTRMEVLTRLRGRRLQPSAARLRA